MDKQKIIWTALTIALLGLGAYYALIKKSDGVSYGWIGFVAGISLVFAIQAYRAN